MIFGAKSIIESFIKTSKCADAGSHRVILDLIDEDKITYSVTFFFKDDAISFTVKYLEEKIYDSYDHRKADIKKHELLGCVLSAHDMIEEHSQSGKIS